MLTGIATLVMNKPPVNSLNLEFLDEIKTQLANFQNDKIRGLMLTSVSILNLLSYFQHLFNGIMIIIIFIYIFGRYLFVYAPPTILFS